MRVIYNERKTNEGFGHPAVVEAVGVRANDVYVIIDTGAMRKLLFEFKPVPERNWKIQDDVLISAWETGTLDLRVFGVPESY